ncbi:MAG: hypothetical protein ABSG96_04265 [Terracidiphilus sp.]|jgi:hypothetical protein
MTKQTYSPRIMYIECKAESLNGSARIGRVTFTRTGATLRYGGRSFYKSTRGSKANYTEEGSGDPYWISGPRRDGTDRLFKSNEPIEIDEDVREEYWIEIRNRPDLKSCAQATLSTTKRPNATSLTRE